MWLPYLGPRLKVVTWLSSLERCLSCYKLLDSDRYSAYGCQAQRSAHLTHRGTRLITRLVAQPSALCTLEVLVLRLALDTTTLSQATFIQRVQLLTWQFKKNALRLPHGFMCQTPTTRVIILSV